MHEWLTHYAWWIGVASLLMFIAGLASLPFLVGRIRADYFLTREPPPRSWENRHPVIRWSLLISKNVFGAVLLMAGLAMLVLPGQGVLTILIGVMLLDFPGKRTLELWIIRRRGVLKAVNWIRNKAQRPPLEVYEDGPPEN